jgi:hypothetical protein
MKKITLGVLLLSCAALVCAQEAVIKEIVGTVEVKAPGEAAWVPAEQGQTVAQAAMVSTGFKSTALIAIGNSTLTVRPLTRLSLSELAAAEDGEKVNVNLRVGRVRADVKPPDAGKIDFTVRSPTATASVRGTVFDFDGTNLRVDEGRVHITGGDRSGVYVGAGHGVSTDIETGRTISVAEAVQEELAPALPAAVEKLSEQTAPPSAFGDLELNLSWK